jgi:hypothetical protein
VQAAPRLQPGRALLLIDVPPHPGIRHWRSCSLITECLELSLRYVYDRMDLEALFCAFGRLPDNAVREVCHFERDELVVEYRDPWAPPRQIVRRYPYDRLVVFESLESGAQLVANLDRYRPTAAGCSTLPRFGSREPQCRRAPRPCFLPSIAPLSGRSGHRVDQLPPACNIRSEHPRSLQPRRIARPNLGQELTGTSPRASVSDTRLWQMAVLPSAEPIALRPYRMRALLRYRGVIDYQHGIAAANEPIRLDQQFCFQRRCIPDPGSNEVMQ